MTGFPSPQECPSDLQGPNKSKSKVPDLETFLEKRDYAGAIALLNFKRRTSSERDPKTLEWLAYAYYHFGEHDKVLRSLPVTGVQEQLQP